MVPRLARLMFCTLFLAVAGVGRAIAPAEVLGVKVEDSSTDPAIGHLRITLDRGTVSAGRVTFEAVNESKSLQHDIVVVHERGTGEPASDLQAGRINEHAVRRLGEIADLAPGKTGKLTLNLGPGTYLLMSTEPGQYKDEMAAKLVVAP